LDKKINNTRDLITTLEDVIRSGYPILINTEDIEQEALATLVVNRLRGALKIATIKAPVLESRRVNILMTLLLSLEVNFIFSYDLIYFFVFGAS
jgi:chaperonin GroEL